MSIAVRFEDIVKEFGSVRVLHGVSFELPRGRVYGLLGENGAGKSTLMKILTGYEQPTGGALLVDGEPRSFANSREAEAAGIVLIHQEFNLAEDLTVAQNIFLGHEKKRGWLLDDAAMRADTARVLAQVGLNKRPRHAGAPADRRREAAGRDRQGAGAQGAAADHGRAHRDADAGRDRARCSS